MNFVGMLKNLWESTGLNQSVLGGQFMWQNYVMLAVACVLLFVGIGLKKEPLLLVPIAFGMLLINIPGSYEILMKNPVIDAETGLTTSAGGFFYYITRGVKWVIFPPIIFLGIGAMTDFGPLIANPKSFILGAAAQLGIFITLFGAMCLGFEGFQAAAIAIIGGADGPTSIYVATKMGVSSGMLSAITVAAYSYMALIPIIQPPIMKLLTTKKERAIRMEQLRPVSKREKIVFPIVVTLVCGLILPDSLPLLGMLMLGNLLKECMVTDRLSQTASNGLMNAITIFLGISVGSMAVGTEFLALDTLKIVVLGLFAFVMGTVGGLLMGKLMCLLSHGKINPLIGSAGVSAVPMAARVSQTVAQKEDPNNYLLMHAMGPNVAGVIGSAVAAGVLLAIF
ncbi:MAG: sodium ion-translocating decarboxylase subunit beta [Clostridiales bacterium]|nr:sodium ion-translocating decarboxylase subunit beta [Clostridiales bacterium]